MNSSPNSIPENAQVIFALKQCVVHGFVEKVKHTITEGECQILGIPSEEDTPSDERLYYLRVKKYEEVLKNSHIFVRINYPENTSYLFESGQGQMNSISFNKENESLEKFETHFSKFSVILDFNSQNIPEELKQKISLSCPEDIETKDITIDGKAVVKKVGKAIGELVGNVSTYVQKPTKAATDVVSQRANNFTRDSVSEQTKSKWNGVVEKSKNINESMTKVVRPIMNVYNNVADSMGEKFYNSENKFIKTIREYGLALADSLNEGEKSKKQTPVAEPSIELKEENSEIQLHN